MESCCNCFSFLKRNTLPVFDYNEIDDVEFENLLRQGSPQESSRQFGSRMEEESDETRRETGGIWTGFASLFRGSAARSLSLSGYHPVPTYNSQRAGRQIPPPSSTDILSDCEELEPSAKLLSRHEIDQKTNMQISSSSKV